MAIQDKIVNEGAVKEFVDSFVAFKKEFSNLSDGMSDKINLNVSEGGIDKNKIHEELKKHLMDSVVNRNSSKLTELETIADLNELWSVAKLLRGISKASESREELLGL